LFTGLVSFFLESPSLDLIDPQPTPALPVGAHDNMTIRSNGNTLSIPSGMSVSVVIPTLNEARNLPAVFEALPAGITEVVVVDGGSTDDTVAVAQCLRPDALVMQQTRRGKGNALACAFEVCTSEVIVMIDADGSTDPREIPAFLAAIANGADFAKGSRFCRGGFSHDITGIRRVGNMTLNTLVNLLFQTRFTDLCYGYNAFRRDLLPVMDLPGTRIPTPADGSRLWGDGFEIETLINIRVARSGCRIAEIPSTEQERMYGESNLDAVRDGLRVLRTIFTERMRPKLRYVPHRARTSNDHMIDLVDRGIDLRRDDRVIDVADVAS
jgi:glycosyltransferase involved in cell wall biosynthesis